MSVPSNFKTEKGTELPLMNLKGKPYLQVAHRLVWLTEAYKRYSVDTNFLALNEDLAIARTTVTVYDDTGMAVRTATATKRETKKDFPDFIEKAETGSLGRALAMLGLGTQFCTQDMDEGDRLADSPIPVAKKAAAPSNKQETVETQAEAPKRTSTFNKNKQKVAESVVEKVEKATPATKTVEEVDGWE